MVKNTFDAYLWQIVENKQKFISQIMTSRSPVRSCEDVDDTALSYAEIKALATGNPYIREKMDLDIKVSRLKLFKANYNSQKYQLEEQIARTFPAQIAAMEERIDGLRSDADAVSPVMESLSDNGVFQMTVGGRVFTERKEAGEAIIAACKDLRAVKTEGQIGEFHGFSISGSFDYMKGKYMLTLKRQRSYILEAGPNPFGNIQRICNALAGIGKRLAEAEQKLETVQQQLLSAQEEVQKPFPKESELAAGLERLAELNVLLNLDGGAESDADCLDGGKEESHAVAETSGTSVYGDAVRDTGNLHVAEEIMGSLKAADAVGGRMEKDQRAGARKKPAGYEKQQDAGSRRAVQKAKKRMEMSL